MQIIDSLTNFDFKSVPIDEFWNTGLNKEQKVHRIHAYPAKFPAFITTKALDFLEHNNIKKPTRIADIFCGCGTTAFEAKRNSIDFWGCDINPVATLIAKVKSNKYQTARLNKYYSSIINSYKTNNAEYSYDDAPERLKYWYSSQHYSDLSRLKVAIFSSTPKNSKYRLFFLCAFSNILKPTSKWLTKSIKPQVDPNKKPLPVMQVFKDQFEMMIAANEEIENLSDASTDIITGNFLSKSWEIPSVDMIITSPPYVTSYEYADLHQLSTLWLDHVKDYRDLREGSIGSCHHDYNFNRELKRLNTSGFKIVALLLDQYKPKAKSVAKYFLDMQEVAKKTFEILNKDGTALFVIGNTEYKNIIIDNAKHLSESLFDAGFSKLHVTKRKISNKILTPYRDKRGKFTTNASGRKIYNEEFIIIGRK